jgi:hypothetical protein
MTIQRRLLAVLVAGLLGAGAVALAVHRSGRAGPQMATTATTSPAPTFRLAPRAGQALVEGTVSSLSADNAQAPPLQPPFLITVPNRGHGGATFREVQVGGQTVAISWYAGQPLPVSGAGGLDLAGAPVSADGTGVTWSLDGALRAVIPGHYHLGAPVGVGASGLATPMDSVSFDAGASATLETSGGANIHFGPSPLHLEGPGRLTLKGQFALRTPDKTLSVAMVDFGPGDYQVDLTPASGGYHISAILQGPLSLRG